MTKANGAVMKSLYQSPVYRGKHVVIVRGKIHTAKNGRDANRLLGRLMKKYPGEVPTLAYIPKDELLILCVP